MVRHSCYGQQVLEEHRFEAILLRSEEKNPCPDDLDNHYPDSLDPKYTIVGKNKLDSIWDVDKLREALSKEERWVIGEPWLLKATFTNNGNVPRMFGFQAGQDKGFMNILVPAGCVECTLSSSGPVLTSAQHAEYLYRDEKPFTSGEVTMSNICLTPQVCKNFECPHPQTQKLKPESFGFSEAACCEPRKCSDEVTCAPTTQWEPRKDFDTRLGSTPQGCCVAKYCPADLCDNITGWDKNPATGLKGSTKEECCIQKECLDWTCSDVRIMRKKPTMSVDPATGKNITVKGWGDIECCEEKKCSEFEIQPELKSHWKLKENAAELTGNELTECCDPRLCGDFSCPNNTQFRPKKSNSVLTGSTVEDCCENLLCSTYTCSNTTTMQKKVNANQRPGSTDEECCELKFCKDYKCRDSSKWIHISDQLGVTNLDRRGSSDEECCEKILCRAEICSPSTSWKPKKNVEEILGSSMRECCEPVYCANFTCDTDDDGDGDGTMWYKRVDTNTYKWQGSTNEECCLPKYCSQYTTSTPTQWKRKPQKDVQGSTDVECYDQLWCTDYCCVGAGWVKKPAPETRPGSTDEECCTRADLPDTHVKQRERLTGNEELRLSEMAPSTQIAVAAAALAGCAFVLPQTGTQSAPALRRSAQTQASSGRLQSSLAASTAVGVLAAAVVRARQTKQSSTGLKAFENELGVQAPLGFWDPAGLSSDGDAREFYRRRVVEIKHGRVSMLACTGYIVQEFFRFPGFLSPSSEIKFTDVPNGLAAATKVPAVGWFQYTIFCGICDLWLMHQVPTNPPGKLATRLFGEGATNYEYGFLGLPGYLGGKAIEDPEIKKKKLNAEIANGRLAMMAIIGMFFQDGLTGSAWGDWANYTESPLRAFVLQECIAGTGGPLPDMFWDPAGISSKKSKEEILELRAQELKHGRVAMLACIGWFHVAGGFHIIGDYAVGVHLDDNPLVSLTQMPMGGIWQVVFTIMCLEWLTTYICKPPAEKPWDILGWSDILIEDEKSIWNQFRKAELQELNNGRLAMMAIVGLITQDVLFGEYGQRFAQLSWDKNFFPPDQGVYEPFATFSYPTIFPEL
ncbi:unnamed protein product [Durusdinium trenchii]|uniref:Uncharacterized protein n=1 Tax=Durusdinium trenchii TaxID=1381693 RepID=A0ABP0HZG2_9DINO